MYVGFSQFQRVIFFCTGNGELFFLNGCLNFHDTVLQNLMSDAILWSCLWFNYILTESKQLSFSVWAVMLFKAITSALPLDSYIFLAFSYFCLSEYMFCSWLWMKQKYSVCWCKYFHGLQWKETCHRLQRAGNGGFADPTFSWLTLFFFFSFHRVHILSSCVAREIFPLCFCRILQVNKINILKFYYVVGFVINCWGCDF